MGVAIIGSVLSSIYASKIGDFLGGTSIKGTAATGIKESLGAALAVAGKLSKTAPDLAASLTHAANSAYVDGMQIGILVAAGATLWARSSPSSGCRRVRAARTSRCRTPGAPRTRRTVAPHPRPIDRSRRPSPSGRRRPNRLPFRRPDMTATTDAEARRPGRPRSTEADEAILEAAVDLFAEGGFDGLTVEGVAARGERREGHDLPPLPVQGRPRDRGVALVRARRRRPAARHR